MKLVSAKCIVSVVIINSNSGFLSALKNSITATLLATLLFIQVKPMTFCASCSWFCDTDYGCLIALLLYWILFTFLLLAKCGGDKSVTGFKHVSLRSGLFLNLAQVHSFYLIPGVTFKFSHNSVVLCGTSDINSYPVFKTNSCSISSDSCL